MDKWNEWYKNLDAAIPNSFKYSDTVTYEKGFNWLKSCDTIEDWGCGTGGFKRFFKEDVKNKYIGIDGSITPFSNIKADLITYMSNTKGIFMRHVLEHNYEWTKILDNALKSFTEKFYLVLFTPFSETTEQIAHNAPHGVDVPDISFSKTEIINIISQNNCVYNLESFQTDTGYGIEHVFYITKKTFLAYYSGFCGTNSNITNQIPKPPSDIYDCYYYTNNLDIYDQLKSTKWIRKFIYIEPSEDYNTSNFHCKHIKVCPHKYTDLQKYTYLVWLDSKIGKLNEDVVSNIISEYSLDNDMMLRVHPWLDGSVWLEVDSSLKQERYIPLYDQMHDYINKQLDKGHKDTTDWHVACGIIIRKMTKKSTKINEKWYRHIIKCGIQDQISFFFVKQLFSRITPFTADIIMEKNEYDW